MNEFSLTVYLILYYDIDFLYYNIEHFVEGCEYYKQIRIYVWAN